MENSAHATFPRANHTLHVLLGVLITELARCLEKKNTLLFPWPVFKLTLNKIELGSQNFGELATGFRR